MLAIYNLTPEENASPIQMLDNSLRDGEIHSSTQDWVNVDKNTVCLTKISMQGGGYFFFQLSGNLAR